jgi:uncharacterized protein (TIGR02217 family)
MSFFEVEFPKNIGYKRLGSPVGFNTTINQGFSGQEQRNRNWANSRGRWTIDLQTPPPSQFSGSRQSYVDLLEAFMLVVGGKADAFRLYDHTDHLATGQSLAHISGNNYQLQKGYTIGGRTYVRTITKPIWSSINDYQGNALSNTVVLKSSGTPLTYSTDWTIDATTGIVTTTHTSLTADFQFHIPVRFDADNLDLQIEESYIAGAGPLIGLHSLQLFEVLPPNY